jgi:hypothetical protein
MNDDSDGRREGRADVDPLSVTSGADISAVRRSRSSGRLPCTDTAIELSGQLLDDSREDSPALRRIDDDRGHGGKVSDDVVFGVEGELRVGGQVGRPVARRGCRDSAQVDVINSSVEHDLDTPRPARTSACRGEVNRAILRRRRGVEPQHVDAGHLI